ncbi:pilus assembly protein [Phycicoccus sp. BSK3Z-2]|uniref:Pilus assembly protein n=1 Tax=Phycicoccus avicenniae TaxID=2828860 RepID=A0A941D6L1_9MICO|nr:TadE/TadG family type IV pilus assembly protein [Phycicoccus avicenniae]MBR7742633.1 pilus assembly protein [Phycicoccus avicenniae]
MSARRERGTASLEFMVLVPFLLLVAFLVWQLAIGGWAAVSANEAARAAARAATLGDDPRAAAEDALPGPLRDFRLSGGRAGDGYSYTVEVEVPAFTAIGLDPVSRTVDMPAELP